MVMVIKGQSEAARNFAKSLGLDPSLVQQIEMRVAADEIVVITTSHVDKKQLNALSLEVKCLNLVDAIEFQEFVKWKRLQEKKRK